MTSERLCKQCLRWLPEEAFQKGALNPNGKPFVRHVCKQCVNFRCACKRNRRPQPVKDERRTCKTCGAEKPLAEFYKNSGGTRHWSCKQCHAARKRERFHAMKANDPAAYAAFKRRRRDWQNRHRAQSALNRLGLGG